MNVLYNILLLCVVCFIILDQYIFALSSDSNGLFVVLSYCQTHDTWHQINPVIFTVNTTHIMIDTHEIGQTLGKNELEWNIYHLGCNEIIALLFWFMPFKEIKKNV